MHFPVFSVSKVLGVLDYNASNPLLFNSGLFLFLFCGFLLIYSLIHSRIQLRNIFVVAFSLYFYYKCSGWYLGLMVGTTIAAFFLTLLIDKAQKIWARKLWLVLSLILYLGLLGYFKYFNLIVSGLQSAGLQGLHFETIFLPLGISFYTFELISYSVDVYQKKTEPLRKLHDFLFYISFFPHLVAGPIVRPQELIPQMFKKVQIEPTDFSRAVFLICAGLIKKAIISDYISLNFVDRIFDNPTLYSGVENLLGAYAYTLQIYCDFSGYSDMAIGIALLLGFKLPDNFNVPYLSTSVTEFWRRWHITLSSWLRDYLYIPLGGNRKGKFRTYLNNFITMLLGGLWHGASVKFILWGGMHGIMLAVEKGFKSIFKLPKNIITSILGFLITFNFVTLCWVFFRASSFQVGVELLDQIVNKFNPQLFMQVITGYKEVFALVLLGYAMHFIPSSVDQKIERFIMKTPLPAKALLVASVIWMVIQVKAADVQPFIYFQF
jgi:alginate O-acetyltransferase complex protein AlgI